MLIIGFLVYLEFGKPIIFKQVRTGQFNKSFTIFKFRTMKALFDPSGSILPDDQRLTRFGSFLRSTSLDELPELINIIKGDMSFVGPRPLLPEYLDLYSSYHRLRHNVKPGLTGFAQINGRNSSSWNLRLDHDSWYVHHYSFHLDFMILFKTFFKVLLRDGIFHPGCATMERFNGSYVDDHLDS